VGKRAGDRSSSNRRGTPATEYALALLESFSRVMSALGGRTRERRASWRRDGESRVEVEVEVEVERKKGARSVLCLPTPVRTI
jgi:hypothetical protein